uniref:glycosyltransferase family 2 protein n=1 Tax=Candidatus Electronema sp. TaxID=2698783 RepID=UPI004056BA0E
MRQQFIVFNGQVLRIDWPPQAAEAVDWAFAEFSSGSGETDSLIAVSYNQDTGRFTAEADGQCIGSGLDEADLSLLLLARAAFQFGMNCRSGPALRCAAVLRNSRSILLSGGAEQELACWLLTQGCGLLTDRLICFTGTDRLLPLPGPLAVSHADLSQIGPVFSGILSAASAEDVLSGSSALLLARRLFAAAPPPTESGPPALLLFAERGQGGELTLNALSPAQAAQRLSGCLANGMGYFPQAAALARQTPALALRFSDFSQLDQILLPVIDFILNTECGLQPLRGFIQAFAALNRRNEEDDTGGRQKKYAVPAATPLRKKQKITVGMAVYDDYDGVYFSVQALRLYHAEIIGQCEILIVDNHPDGTCAEHLKRLDSWTENCRYIPLADAQGTGAARNAIFAHAVGDHVLCMDCHVLLVPGALRRLADYFAACPDSPDLLQGPLLHDDLRTISTHFEPVWRDGMYGVWGHDPRGDDPAGESFDIPMQGVGLFACRRDAWPGFNPSFYGFGADEGYIHEKFRQAGGRTLCLPFLRWLHRFARPLGAPYPLRWKDRIRNYLLGFSELGLDTAPVREHFTALLGREKAEAVFREVAAEMAACGQKA